MKLTANEELFCQEFVKCGNATQAYRKSYSVNKAKSKSVNELASRLKAKIKISSRIEDLQAILLDGQILKAKEIQILLSDKVREGLESDGLKAVDILNKMQGNYEKDNVQKDKKESILVTFK